MPFEIPYEVSTELREILKMHEGSVGWAGGPQPQLEEQRPLSPPVNSFNLASSSIIPSKPPSYHEETGHCSANPDDVPVPNFTMRATNFVSIDEEKSIRENYTIDTSLQPIHMNFDLGMAIPTHRDEVRHLELRSRAGYIQTKIRLIGSHRETAMFLLETQGSDIDASVVCFCHCSSIGDKI